jgi:hypothetical protein
MIRFSAEQAPYVRERIWHPTQPIQELSDGRIELSFRAGGMFEDHAVDTGLGRCRRGRQACWIARMRRAGSGICRERLRTNRGVGIVIPFAPVILDRPQSAAIVPQPRLG